MKNKNQEYGSPVAIGGWVILAIVGIIFIKSVGLLVLIGIASPILAIWLIWKKSKFNKKKKIQFTGAVVGIFIIICGLITYSNRAPSLKITSPENGTSVQAKTISIEGKVKPSSSTLTVNGLSAEIKNGSFKYEFNLNKSEEKNSITIEAKNSDKITTQTLIVNRIFTEEEKVAIETAKLKVQQEKEAQLAKEKAEQQAYDNSPAGRICKKHPDWTKSVCETLSKGKVRVGMTKEQARIGWGNPDDINKTITTYGTSEQWVYGYSSYLYFDDGILTSIQN